ncbi:hypothetical protein A2W14_04435 [Candidatus Gottesmanbacteria bacterium RBG_16_37_8]|uniref:Pseudouridine synthase RsuA/RluA-like domain-containing protein n=1 Tax=Candidatus Gottesmanbacteria bacterium RBG_16_37_8 TaxID=1798371 RepID=A0A1F5YSC1_9BACT|nr:MAG: hypothetical protein A2W14_04435 [Candidatus Gottesmanbacteria bacterium RBG_16_37_8]
MPYTGRTHQIRIHLKHSGFSIIADPLYSGRKVYREDIKICPRLFLHAQFLEFRHPQTDKIIKFESPLPDELQKVLNQLHKFND